MTIKYSKLIMMLFYTAVLNVIIALTIHGQSRVSTMAAEHGEPVLKIIVPLNLENQETMVPSWERGREILQGALFVKYEINNSSDLQLQIKLMDVNNGQCSGVNNYNLLKEIVDLTHNDDLDFTAVVGLHCNKEFQYLLQPASSNTTSYQRLKTLHEESETIEELLLIHVKPAPSNLIEAIFKFMNIVNWQNIGIMTEVEDSYFSRTAAEVYNKAKSYIIQAVNVNVTRYHQLQSHSSRVALPTNISKITVLSTSLQNAEDILCQAQRKKMIWPQYVWILHSFLFQDITSIHTSCPSNKNVFDNIILIRKQPTSRQCHTFSGGVNLSEVHAENPYAITLYNLIVETVETFLNLNASDSTNCRIPRPGVIEVTQVRDFSEIPIAMISGDEIIMQSQVIQTLKAISDKHDIQFEGATTAYNIIFGLEICLGFLLVTTMLVCYIYFRNEPEVKSTSFTLSLLIFLGCYLNLLFLSLLLYFHQPIVISEEVLNTICGTFPWISGLGISISLIVATVLVKLVRVYHIFNRITLKPLGKMGSDLSLAGYVLLILLPLLTMLTIWIATDRFKVTYQPSSQPGLKQKQCLSDYLTIWLPLLLLYVIALFVTLAIVAICSRKIRDKHFRDTKKVNMFIFCLFFVVILALSFWWLLENLGTSVPFYVAAIPLHIGHIGVVCLCQLLLIIPKISAPLTRFMHSSKDIKPKHEETNKQVF